MKVFALLFVFLFAGCKPAEYKVTIKEVIKNDAEVMLAEPEEKPTSAPEPEVEEPEPEPEESNSIVVLDFGNRYRCWIYNEHQDLDKTNYSFNFEYENAKYDVFIVDSSTRFINFKGKNWDKAAQYLGIVARSCIREDARKVEDDGP
jgi:hypothetical protein